jgi:hypothetical protein
VEAGLRACAFTGSLLRSRAPTESRSRRSAPAAPGSSISDLKNPSCVIAKLAPCLPQPRAERHASTWVRHRRDRGSGEGCTEAGALRQAQGRRAGLPPLASCGGYPLFCLLLERPPSLREPAEQRRPRLPSLSGIQGEREASTRVRHRTASGADGGRAGASRRDYPASPRAPGLAARDARVRGLRAAHEEWRSAPIRRRRLAASQRSTSSCRFIQSCGRVLSSRESRSAVSAGTARWPRCLSWGAPGSSE